MKFARMVVWDLETLQITARYGCEEYNGPVAKLCGATGGQKSAAANETKVSNLLTTDFQQIFGTNTNILKSVTDALEPVVSAGPDQYGFGAAEDSAMRTQATDQISAANRNATNALRSSLVSEGGGHAVLPSGSGASLEGELAEIEAQKQSAAQLAITEKGYETGRQDFFGAEGALTAAPGALENPATAAGGAAEGASTAAMGGQTDIANANNAWIAPVAGLVGAVGGAALGKPGK